MNKVVKNSEVPDEIRAYWDFRDENSVYDGVLLKSHQLVVPASLQPELLQKIHIKRKRKHIKAQIVAYEEPGNPSTGQKCRQTCSSCGVCSQYLRSEWPQEPMQTHTILPRPWERVSADLFQLDGSNYLVLVDHYRNTSAVAVIRAMKRNFVRHGIPDKCITDNGPQFVSHEYACLHVNMDSQVLNHPPITVEEMEKRNLQSRLRKIFSRSLALRTRTWLFWPIETPHIMGTNIHQHRD